MICYFGWTLSTLALPDLTTIVLDRGFADVCISVLKVRQPKHAFACHPFVAIEMKISVCYNLLMIYCRARLVC